MRIGIDGTLLRGQDAGTLRIFEHLLHALAARVQPGGKDEVIFFADEAVIPPQLMQVNSCIRLSNVHKSRIIPGALRQQFYNSWNRFGPLNILHTVGFVPPVHYSGKKIMTIFDLTPFLFPQTQKWTGQMWWRLLGPVGIRQADHIIALSHTTASDLMRLFSLRKENIAVIYPFVSFQFRPVPLARQVIAKYGLSGSYLLYVGTLEPRKNLVTLINAYALARKEWGITIPLVIAGKKGWLYSEILGAVRQHELEGHVKFLGYVPDEDLPALYTAADLFLLLSLYEGFGLPLIEAMACGAPALVSDIPVLAEVAGDAAIRIPPLEVEAIAREMASLLTRPERREVLREAGFNRSSLFTQQRFIHETLAIYQKVTGLPFGKDS